MTSYVSLQQLIVSSFDTHFSNIWSSHITDLDSCQMTNLCLVTSDLSNPPLSVHQAILLPLCPMLGNLVKQDHSHHQPTIIFPDISLSVLQGLLTLIYRGYCGLTKDCTRNDLQSLMQSLGMAISNLAQDNLIETQLQGRSPSGQPLTTNPQKDETMSGIKQVYPHKSVRRSAKCLVANKPVTHSIHHTMTQLRPKPTLTSVEHDLSNDCSDDNDLQDINNNQSSQAIISSPVSIKCNQLPYDNRKVKETTPFCSALHCMRPQKGHKGEHGRNCSLHSSSMSVLNPDNSSKCEECGEMCLSSVHLVYHTSLRHQDKSDSGALNCRFCNFIVMKEKKSRLLDHLQTKHAEYLCSLCEETFMYSSNGIRPIQRFLMHNKEIHKDQANVTLNLVTPVKHEHACTECNWSNTSLAKLYYHMATRHGEPGSKSYQCIFCPYSRSKAGRGGSGPLLEHLLVHHTEEKNYVCAFCGQKFAARKTKINHEKLHTGEKNHKCDQCDAKFVQLGSLKSHIRVHHEQDKKLMCRVCGKRYKVEKTLAIHEKLHTVEKC